MVLDKIANLGEGRKRKNLESISQLVMTYEPEFEELTDDELLAKTTEFRQRAENGESLDDLLPEAFAVVREASVRSTGKRHFDVQVMGAAALHQGNIAEMKTGEGKTLVATMPAYLNSLTGKGVHLVTVNDYLAKRDSEWMGPIYRFLGVHVGLIQSAMTPTERRPAYGAPTSPTARTTSSGSTTCATTWRCGSRTACSADYQLRDRGRGRLDPHRRGADPADHQRHGGRTAPSGTRRSRGSRHASKRDEDYEVDESKFQVAVTENRASPRSRRCSASRTSTST